MTTKNEKNRALSYFEISGCNALDWARRRMTARSHPSCTGDSTLLAITHVEKAMHWQDV